VWCTLIKLSTSLLRRSPKFSWKKLGSSCITILSLLNHLFSIGCGLYLDQRRPVSTGSHRKINTIDRTWFSRGPDMQIVLTRVREGKCCDRTRLGNRSDASTVCPVHFQRGTSLTGRVRSSPIRLVHASGQSTEMVLHDRTRPVTPDWTHCASSHSAPLFFNSTVAIDRTHPVTSTGTSGQYLNAELAHNGRN
jgi:hypothetical protein